MIRQSRSIALLLLLWPSLATHAQAATAVWIGSTMGDWDDPTNWSTGAVPTVGDVVVIDDNAGQASSVNAAIGYSPRVHEIQVDVGDKLTVEDFRVISADISGELSVTSGGYSEGYESLVIQPTGHVGLEGVISYDTSFPPAPPVSWQNHGVVSGLGVLRFSGELQNTGIIEANTVSDPLVVDFRQNGFNFSTLFNPGTLRASNGSTLALDSAAPGNTLQNYVGNSPGRIEALAGSRVTIDDLSLLGGTLYAESDAPLPGQIQISDSNVQDAVLEGDIEATETHFLGAIENRGMLRLHEGGGLNATLHGSGVVEFDGASNSHSPFLVGGTNENNMIRGSGTIGISDLTNRGVIEVGFGEANSSGSPQQVLSLVAGTINNSGVIRATLGNHLVIDRTTLENAEETNVGLVEAMPGAGISFDEVEMRGGVLRAHPADGEEEDALLGLSRSTLADLRLEGTIGNIVSDVDLSGRVENGGTLRINHLTIQDNVEIVGGLTQLAGSPHATLQLGSNSSSVQPRLTLTNSILQVGNGGSNDYAGSGMTLCNRGTILGTAGSGFTFRDIQVENEGVIEAVAGSSLGFENITSTMKGQGYVYAAPGGHVSARSIQGGTVGCPTGGTCDSGFGIVGVGGDLNQVALADVTNMATVKVDQGRLAGTIENHGNIEALGTLLHDSSLNLVGAGELSLGTRTLASHSSGIELINGEGHTIRGPGHLAYSDNSITNQGSIVVESGTLAISLANGQISQHGLLRSEGTGTLLLNSFPATFTNKGSFEIAGTKTVFDFDCREIINASGAAIVVDTLLETRGARRIINMAGGTVVGSGEISGFASSQEVTTLINHGLLIPDGLDLRGDFVQTSEGTLRADVTALGGSTFLLNLRAFGSDSTGTIGGHATLAGTLDFHFAAGVMPQLGDEVRVLSTPGIRDLFITITGQFDTITGLPTLDAGLAWRMLYEPTSVTAAVVLAGDFNLDGSVNIADYTLWRNSLGATEPALAADANGDSVVDMADYDLWKTYFGNTTADFPAAAVAHSVPEPGAVWLLLAGIAASVFPRRRSLQ